MNSNWRETVFNFSKGIGWILLCPSILISLAGSGLLLHDWIGGTYDCKSQSIYGLVLVFFGVILTLMAGFLLLFPRWVRGAPMKVTTLLIGSLLLIQIAALALNGHLAHGLQEDCSTWENG